jgi:tetratricopeptide (TPR) repeat protein
MPERRSSRAISLGRVNAVLYALIACLAVFYWSDLLWAVRALPEYLTGSIQPTKERSLCVGGAGKLTEANDLAAARTMLEKSLAIDPTSEALYWLAECSYQEKRYDDALRQFEAFIEIDPLVPEAYLTVAELLVMQKQPERARQILRRGAAYLGRAAELYRPRPDKSVRPKYNLKASATYMGCHLGAEQLREALARLEVTP